MALNSQLRDLPSPRNPIREASIIEPNSCYLFFSCSHFFSLSSFVYGICSGRIECGSHRDIANLRIKQRVQFASTASASLLALRYAFSTSSVVRQSSRIGTSASSAASHHDHSDGSVKRIASPAFYARRNH